MCPSENPASHFISGLSSQGLSPGLGLPVEGRALHARMGGYAFTGGSPPGPPGVPLPRMIMSCLGLRLALQRGRTECVPPRKTLSALSQGLPRKAILPGLIPLEGRALHARMRMPWLHPGMPPLGHRLLANTSAIMTCPGLRPALDLGRAERIPPRKPPFALSQDFPRGHRSPDPLPAEQLSPVSRVSC